MDNISSLNFDLAHKHSYHNREEILRSELCGCFYCCNIYPPTDILEWTDELSGSGLTALCPKCEMDSVIGSNSGLTLSKNFLRKMHEYWFK